MAAILVLNGPNLNLLGKREPELYGTTTLQQIDGMLATEAAELGHELECFQSNAEHELIDKVHRTGEAGVDFIIINPGAFTHTSIALRDALLGVAVPYIEVHLSNIFAREPYRQHSYLSDAAVGVISGLGPQGYLYALKAVDQKLRDRRS